MKLLIDARPIIDPLQGGVSRVSLELVTAYATQFPEDTIICATTGTRRPLLPSRLTSHTNVIHCHIPLPNKLWSALCLLNLVSLTRSVERNVGKIDAALFPNFGFIGNSHVPTILLLHDLSFIIEPRWFRFKQRLWHHAVRATKQIQQATHLLAVSETTKNDALHFLNIPENKISVIPIGQTLSAYAQNVAPSTSRYILALGKNDARKNIATIFVAVQKLNELEAYSDIRVITPQHGITDQELATLYANASVFAYPSWYEGYGLPLHEASQFGIPCIASTTGALPETTPPNTFFANPAKPQQWVEAIKLALQTPHKPHIPNSQHWNTATGIVHKLFERIVTSTH